MRSLRVGDQKSIVFSRLISPGLRAKALLQEEFTCRMCGLAPGEIDWTTGRKARLRVAYIVDKSLGGNEEVSNLSAVCSICEQGRKHFASRGPTRSWLLSQVQRAEHNDQLAVLNWLDDRFTF